MNPSSASIMADMTKKRLVHREYLAIVKGDLTPPTGTITAPLSRKEGSIIERTVDFDHGEEAITHYKMGTAWFPFSWKPAAPIRSVSI